MRAGDLVVLLVLCYMCINLFGLFICCLLWVCSLVCFVWVGIAVLFLFAITCLGVRGVLFGGACGFRFVLLFC